MTDSLFKDYFPFELNEDQETAFLNMAAFLENDAYHIFQLIGYAGTGKTTLVSGFLKYLGENVFENIYWNWFYFGNTGCIVDIPVR